MVTAATKKVAAYGVRGSLREVLRICKESVEKVVTTDIEAIDFTCGGIEARCKIAKLFEQKQYMRPGLSRPVSQDLRYVAYKKL